MVIKLNCFYIVLNARHRPTPALNSIYAGSDYTNKYDNITPILRQLHWLPVTERIDYKILLLTFKSLHGMAPEYLSELLSVYKPGRSLRSSGKSLLVTPKYKYLKSYGQRAFSCAAPVLWNSLPDDIRSCNSLTVFKSKLKIFLFKRYFI